MTHPSLLTEEQLKEATGYQRRSDLERCLRKQGIRYWIGREGRIWTTTLAMIDPQRDDRRRVEF